MARSQSTEKDKSRIEGEEVGRPDLGIWMEPSLIDTTNDIMTIAIPLFLADLYYPSPFQSVMYLLLTPSRDSMPRREREQESESLLGVLSCIVTMLCVPPNFVDTSWLIASGGC